MQTLTLPDRLKSRFLSNTVQRSSHFEFRLRYYTYFKKEKQQTESVLVGN